MDTTSWPAGTANGALGAPLKSDTTGKLVFDFYFTPTVAAALDAVNQTTNSFIGNKLFAVAAVGSTASKVVPISAPPAPTPAVPNVINWQTGSSSGNLGLTGQPTSSGSSSGGGGGGKVICTELWKRGILSDAIYMKDREFGTMIVQNYPWVYVGYRRWADIIVRGMRKSDHFTNTVASIAVPWARQMAGDKNTFGAVVMYVGLAFCGIMGIDKLLAGKVVHEGAINIWLQEVSE